MSVCETGSDRILASLGRAASSSSLSSSSEDEEVELDRAVVSALFAPFAPSARNVSRVSSHIRRNVCDGCSFLRCIICECDRDIDRTCLNAAAIGRAASRVREFGRVRAPDRSAPNVGAPAPAPDRCNASDFCAFTLLTLASSSVLVASPSFVVTTAGTVGLSPRLRPRLVDIRLTCLFRLLSVSVFRFYFLLFTFY